MKNDNPFVFKASTSNRMGDNRLFRAQMLHDRHRYDLAEKMCREILGTDPTNHRAHALLALSLSARGKKKEALRSIQEAVHLAPIHARHHHVRGLLFANAGKLNEAESSCREALRLDPNQADFFYLKAF